MLPQIVCLSCGYHRTWPTLLADQPRLNRAHEA